MKTLQNYIFEAIKKLPKHISGVIVFDIDDTLLKVDKSMVCVYKQTPNGKIKISTEEFAKDPDAGDASKKHLFDLSDFRDPKKVYSSIINGTPIIKNLKIMDSYINAGYDFCFLTARGAEDVVKQALDDFLKVKCEDGTLRKLGNIFKKTISHAVNDEYKKYPGKTDAEKKANVLLKLCKDYDKVVFVDDDDKNLELATSLNQRNLTIIKAWE
jgi:FMN phosphatase YigB (HAD superfamily)